KVVANLPFCQGTSILRRLLDPRVALTGADVIVEWDLARKRTAVWPSTRLSVEWGAWFELSLVRRLPRSCFAPPPSVDAGVLHAVRRAVPLVPRERAREYSQFVERGFRNGVRAVVPSRRLKKLAAELGCAPSAQARDLDACQWAALFGRSA